MQGDRDRTCFSARGHSMFPEHLLPMVLYPPYIFGILVTFQMVLIRYNDIWAAFLFHWSTSLNFCQYHTVLLCFGYQEFNNTS